MSVLTIERHSEEFPELADICHKAFAASIASGIPLERPSRTTPSYDVVTMEDLGANSTALIAAREFATVAMIKNSGIVSKTSPNTPPPKATCFTTEDGGQSMGAKETSAYAALLLANLDEEHAPVSSPSPRCVPSHRPCNGERAYCC
jgi:hypothetical protein